MMAAVASLIAITTLLIAAVIYGFQFTSERHVQAYDRGTDVFSLAAETMNWQLFGTISIAVIAIVALGSVYKLAQLSSGGRTVAEAMGGRLLNISTRDADEKKILNVVEEMAIASGTPVPPVYLIDDDSINAFAAGFSPQDAVIGITRGCIRLLSRDELQGVIAHEFSHILHGDMRLNIRLVGILHGILVIGLIGYFFMRSGGYQSFSRRGRNNAAAMLFLGLGLMVVGYAGTFFGNIIKAAVSRQREFLADASAVQFTRNPTGISGALKKIGGYSRGSKLSSPHAAEYSHMYFGQGITIHLTSLMATHPPLPVRIRRIEPGWNGEFPRVDVAAAPTGDRRRFDDRAPAAAQFAGELESMAEPAPEPAAQSALDSIGQPSHAHVQHAHDLIDGLPNHLREAAHDPFSARALVYSLLFDKHSNAVREQQWSSLRQHSHPVVFDLTRQYIEHVAELPRHCHLTLLELCIPTLKALSEPQYQVFKRNLVELIRADQRVDLFEWSLYRIVIYNVEAHKPSLTSHRLQGLRAEIQQLLSVLAYAGHEQPHQAKRAYDKASVHLGLGQLPMLSAQSIQFPMLDAALDKLRDLKPLQKPNLLKAMVACITHDNEVTPTEAELFRAIADSLDCPVPPLLAGQRLA